MSDPYSFYCQRCDRRHDRATGCPQPSAPAAVLPEPIDVEALDAAITAWAKTPGDVRSRADVIRDFLSRP